jgi:Rieske Fe-S protein
MNLNRRQFVVIAAAVATGCKRSDHQRSPASKPAEAATQESGVIDAGPIRSFPPDTVSDGFRTEGFFVIHRDQQVFALSSVCTHKGCKVRVAADQSFYCKCHGSTFSRDGRVTKGPASRELPRLSVREGDHGHLLVKLPA